MVASGVGLAIKDKKDLKFISNNLSLITGQKSLITKAKKSISTFKLRTGMPIGCKVTLRKNIMYEFIDRLVNLALPRTRDFRGISPNSFDRFGNYHLGIKEHNIFIEINIDTLEFLHGLQVSFITSTDNYNEAYFLLKQFGMPFRTKFS